MISQDIVELNGLIEASLSARRRLASLNRISGLRLSELRSLEKACESADDEIEAFHHCHREPTHCEFAGVDAGRFTARKEIVALLAPAPESVTAPLPRMVRGRGQAHRAVGVRGARSFLRGLFLRAGANAWKLTATSPTTTRVAPDTTSREAS